jgi:hypothetical protein
MRKKVNQMKKIKVCLNKSIINKANSKNKKEMYAFTSEFERFELTPAEFLNEVAGKGFAFCSSYLIEGEHEYCYKKEENFGGSNILAIDIDNVNKNGVKKTDEEGYCTLEMILNDPRVKELASFVYTTPSFKESHHRFRIVFVTSAFITEKETFSKAIKTLNNIFGGDVATTSLVQGFYGAENSKYTFFDNILPDDEFDRLIQIYDEKNNKDIIKLDKSEIEGSKFSIDDIDELLKYIFKKGKISNDDWWKIPTILVNSFNLTQDQIITLIAKHTDVGDTKEKLKYADRYKDVFTPATLIWLAQQNGYEIPNHLRGENYLEKFWTINKNEDKEGKLVLSNYKTQDYLYQKFLQNKGFYLYVKGNSQELIQVQGNIIQSSSEAIVRNVSLKYIDGNKDLYSDKLEATCVKNGFRKDMNRLFPNTIKNLYHINSDEHFYFVKDKVDTSYVFYNNGCRVIKKNNDKLVEYSKISGFIRSDKILNRSFKVSDGKPSIIQKYIKRLSTNRLEEDKLDYNKDKYNSLISIIGYLATNYKKKDNAVAIILTDSNLTLSDESEGGSGKSLFAKIISFIRKQVVIDGRNFKSDSDFKLDQIDESTDVCLINDCASNFPFESFYNYITDDLVIQKKYKSSEVITFENSPKFIFTSNSVLGGDGSSDIRRRVEIEVSNYYDLKHKPSDEFGILFDWDEDEWARYDDFIGKCIRYYYKNGIIPSKSTNAMYKRLEIHTSIEFAEYATLYLKEDKLYWMDSILQDFTQKTGCMLTYHTLTKYLNSWAKYSDTNMYNEYIKSENNKRVVVFSSEKNKNLIYWKTTTEFKKLILLVDTFPSKY